MAKRNALGNVHRLAWMHESPKVRLAALALLTKGRARIEHVSDEDTVAIDALVGAGCDMSVEHNGIVSVFVFTCEGAKECYENGAFFDFE